MRNLPRHISVHMTLAQDERGLDGAPHLRRLLTVADRTLLPGQDERASLCAMFDAALAADPPVAALESIGAGPEAHARQWLRADPIHLRPQRDDLVCWPVDDLQPSDAAALIDTLNAFLSEDDLALAALDVHRWLLALPSTARLRTTPVSRVTGSPVGPHLPTGEDAARWLTRLTELQMLLHAHPVNARREEEGKVPVSSLWLWGGGARPVISTRRFDLVCAHDALTRGLAHCAGSALGDVPDSIVDLAPVHAVLLAVPAQADLASLDAVWFAALRPALAAGHVESVEIVLNGGEAQRFLIRPRHLWRFWRRTSPF